MSIPVLLLLHSFQNPSLNSSYLFELMTSPSICSTASTAIEDELYLLLYADVVLFVVIGLDVEVGHCTSVKSKHKNERRVAKLSKVLKLTALR
jgi:hypothetical protein